MATYAERHLLKGESILHETTYHWVHFISWKALISLFIIPIIQQLTDEFVITNRRIIIKKGLIRIWTFEMSLRKIESVFVDQSILGRILNFGTVTITGSGGTREIFIVFGNHLCSERNLWKLSLI
ncbi:MAG: PH domain-containing protein [Saprospiraceae bacterium]|nr:PH domain-containing protein [Saprospiraceae bacterium]